MLTNKKILHINHTTWGGTGRVANTIIESLQMLNYDNIFATVRGETKHEKIYLSKKQYYFSKILSKVYAKLSTSVNPIEPEVFCFSKIEELSDIIDNDGIEAIILYWVRNTIPMEDISRISQLTNAKIYIYLMDEAFLSGGCFYFDTCENYIRGCGNCPSILWGKFSNDITHRNALKNRKIFENIQPIILCPSTQSLIDAQRSYVLRDFKKEKLLIPLSNEYTEEISKKDARAKLNITDDSIFLFLGASSLSNYRKGIKYLLEALEIVYDKLDETYRTCVKILIAGNTDGMNLDSIKFQSILLGYLSHKELIMAYKSSDVFISSSIIDMGPMMVNESIRSGVPVVCFDIGISKDLVINGKTGYRVEKKNSREMAEAILKMIKLNEKEKSIMSDNCLELGEKLLSYEEFNNIIQVLFK